MVGKTFSFADKDTKNENGTIHKHMVKYARTCKKMKYCEKHVLIMEIMTHWKLKMDPTVLNVSKTSIT